MDPKESTLVKLQALTLDSWNKRIRGKKASTTLYEPLPHPNSFRLLALKAAEADQPLVAELYIAELDDKVSYDAISYVWGNLNDVAPITVNSQKVMITKTLHVALRQALSNHKTKVLWADQICINQDDVNERGHQVLLMGKIFKLANQVNISLGVDDRKIAPETFRAVRELNTMIGEQLTTYGSFQKLPIVEVESDFVKSIPWKLLRELDKCRWFTRLWCVQEVGLAKAAILMWGDERLNWVELMATKKWLWPWGRRIRDQFHLTRRSLRLWASFDPENRVTDDRDSPRNFLDVIQTTTSLTATDPRDRIYALLGHPFAQELGIIPDYDKTIENVCQDLAQKWVLVKQSITILAAVRHATSNPADLVHHLQYPSWCPRWDLTTQYLVKNFGGRFIQYEAAALLHPEFELIGHQLKIKGFIFDTVRKTTPVITRKDTKISPQTIEDNIIPRIATEAVEDESVWQHPYDDRLRALASALVMGFDDTSSHADANGLSLVLSQLVTDAPDSHGLPDFMLDRIRSNASSEGIWEYLARIRKTALNHRAFTTNTGYIGIGSMDVTEGDKLCIVFGLSVPFILRPLHDSTYLAIGYGYTEGIMHGETIDMLDEGKFSSQQFILR